MAPASHLGPGASWASLGPAGLQMPGKMLPHPVSTLQLSTLVPWDDTEPDSPKGGAPRATAPAFIRDLSFPPQSGRGSGLPRQPMSIPSQASSPQSGAGPGLFATGATSQACPAPAPPAAWGEGRLLSHSRQDPRGPWSPRGSFGAVWAGLTSPMPLGR